MTKKQDNRPVTLQDLQKEFWKFELKLDAKLADFANREEIMKMIDTRLANFASREEMKEIMSTRFADFESRFANREEMREMIDEKYRGIYNLLDSFVHHSVKNQQDITIFDMQFRRLEDNFGGRISALEKRVGLN